MKRRKVHPADAANTEVLANAVRYDVALFLGTGRYARASAPTLEEARVEAKRRSCPTEWCSWPRCHSGLGQGRFGQACATGSMTVGSSPRGAMVSSVM